MRIDFWFSEEATLDSEVSKASWCPQTTDIFQGDFLPFPTPRPITFLIFLFHNRASEHTKSSRVSGQEDKGKNSDQPIIPIDSLRGEDSLGAKQ